MSFAKCHHGDLKRNKQGRCSICRRESQVRTKDDERRYHAIKTDPDRWKALLKTKREYKRRRREVLRGYTTIEAAERLRMDAVSLLRGWSDLARIYNADYFTGPVIQKEDNSRRWNRQQIDQLATTMFQDQWKRK